MRKRLAHKFDSEAIRRDFRRPREIAFKIAMLIALCGFALGPIMHMDTLARVLGAISSVSLTILAALYLFSRRSSDRSE